MKKLLLKLKYKNLLDEIENLEITEIALKNYKECIYKNKFKDNEILEKKLRRNFVLAEDVNDYTKKYGNLYIYHAGNIITNIFSQKGNSDGLKIDKKLKKNLDTLLHIE